ncbi:hypothetical protein HKCCE3408_18180 [Rhodobacterales bacterium HKCCE3408]|nr:hypothetical protein [Rhodobacterales bacterium HKCCE3408]
MPHRALFACLAILAAAPAAAQDFIDTSLASVAEFTRGFAYVERVEPAVGDQLPAVLGTLNGLNFDILLYDCAPGDVACGSAQFRASFDAPDATLEFINDWNYDYRFAAAYRVPEGSIMLAMNVNFAGGVTREAFRTAFRDWEFLLTEFSDRIFPPEDGPVGK